LFDDTNSGTKPNEQVTKFESNFNPLIKSGVYNSFNFDYDFTNKEFISRFFLKYDILSEYMMDYAGLSRIIFIPLGVEKGGVKCYIEDGLIYGSPYKFEDSEYTLNFTYNGNTINNSTFNLHVLFANISYLRLEKVKTISKSDGSVSTNYNITVTKS
jgi:hypothetical protein